MRPSGAAQAPQVASRPDPTLAAKGALDKFAMFCGSQYRRGPPQQPAATFTNGGLSRPRGALTHHRRFNRSTQPDVFPHPMGIDIGRIDIAHRVAAIPAAEVPGATVLRSFG